MPEKQSSKITKGPERLTGGEQLLVPILQIPVLDSNTIIKEERISSKMYASSTLHLVRI